MRGGTRVVVERYDHQTQLISPSQREIGPWYLNAEGAENAEKSRKVIIHHNSQYKRCAPTSVWWG